MRQSIDPNAVGGAAAKITLRLLGSMLVLAMLGTLLLGGTPAGAAKRSRGGTASAVVAKSSRHVVAETFMEPQTGGYLATRRGVAIRVPAGVMRHAGYVKITSLGRGRYDVHIDAPWSGSVEVTLPLHSPQDRVVHKVGGVWVTESQTAGQNAVVVTQLSVFSDALGKIAGKLCLTTDLVQLVECVGGHLDSKLKSWIESKLPHDCAVQLAEGGNPLGVVKAAVSGDCVGQAGEVGYHVPTTPPATTPSPSNPAPTGGGAPASPPSNPSPPVPSGPPPSSPPPVAKSIQIGWSGTHSGWIWMTLNGFATGSHQYTCAFASGGDATFTLGEVESPETWDNGHTCEDFEHGDTVWVEVEGVSSNSIVVP
jgi:hypothetical protein